MSLSAHPPHTERNRFLVEDEREILDTLAVFPVGSQEPLALADLGDVFINDNAVLHEVELLSRRDYPVLVSMRWEHTSSDAGLDASLEFQLENANLRALRDAESDPSSTAPYFNEVLNQTCTISECLLLPGKRRPLIFVLHPCLQDETASATSFLKLHGFVHLSVRRATATELKAYDVPSSEYVERIPSAATAIADGTSLEGGNELPQRRDSPGGRDNARDLGRGAGRGVRGDERDEQMLLSVRAKVCQSILSADTTELQFLARPGALCVKEFSVWNKSEIPLTFRLVPSVSLSPEEGVLACSDYDSGTPLPTSSSGRTIGAYAHLRVRVTFRPREVREREYRISIENLNNVANNVAVDILTSVVSESHREGLRIETDDDRLLEAGSVLQFDNCYTGIPTMKRLYVKNTSVMAMDISLSSDRPDEVMFELETDAVTSSRRARNRLLSIGGDNDGNASSGTTSGSRRRRSDSVAFDSGGAGIGDGAGAGTGVSRGRSRRSVRSERRASVGSRACEGEGAAQAWAADDEGGIGDAGSRGGAAGDGDPIVESSDSALEGGGAGGVGLHGRRFESNPALESGLDRSRTSSLAGVSSLRINGRRRNGSGDNHSGEGEGLIGRYGGSTYGVRQCSVSKGAERNGGISRSSRGGGGVEAAIGDGIHGVRVLGWGSGQGSGNRRARANKASGIHDEHDDGEEYNEDEDIVGGGSSGRRGDKGMVGSLGRAGGDRGLGDSDQRSRGGDGDSRWSYVPERQERGMYDSQEDDDEDDDDDEEEEDAMHKEKHTSRHKSRYPNHHNSNASVARSGEGGLLCAHHRGLESLHSGGVCPGRTSNGGGSPMGEALSHDFGVISTGSNTECRLCAKIILRNRGKDIVTVDPAQERPAVRSGLHNNYIEELSLGPGDQRTLRVTFCPKPASDAGGITEGGADGEDSESASATRNSADGPAERRTSASSQRRGSVGSGGGGRGNRINSNAATALGTKLTKQAFKISFGCQEPRGQWDDALLGGDDVDAEGYAHSKSLLRRKLSVGSDVRQFSKNIAGRAMVCTSVVSASPRELSFGNCNIGEYKSRSLEVSNLSDLPAVVMAHVVSKVVTLKPAKIEIPPHGKAEVKVEYVPGKINSKYRKMITLINAYNPLGHVEVEIAASNIDTHHVLYHSHFYKVSVSNRMRQQQVYFNHVVTGCPSLRVLNIQNIWGRHLQFEMGADTEEIQMYEMVEFPLPGGSSARATEVASGVDMASAKGTVAAVGGSRGGLSPGSSPRMGDNSWREQALKTVTREGTESDIGHRSSYGRTASGRTISGRRDGRHVLGPIEMYRPYGGQNRRGSRKPASRHSSNCGGGSLSDSFDSAKEGGGSGRRTAGGGTTASGVSGDGVGGGAGGAGESGVAKRDAGGAGDLAMGRSGRKGSHGNGSGSGAGGGGGGSVGRNRLAIPSQEDGMWTPDELIGSFEADRLPKRWQYDAESGGSGPISAGRVGSSRVHEASSGGSGGREKMCSGGLSAGFSSRRSQQETRALQVDLMRERVMQLRRALKDGRLKPLGSRPFQVPAGKSMRVAVILCLKSSGEGEELQRERALEMHIQMKLLNVYSSHLPSSLRHAVGPSERGGDPGGEDAGGGSSMGGKGRSVSPMSKREPLRVRNLLVSGKMCRLEMSIAQKNINFGKVAVGEYATRTVTLANRSPVPLFYSISKSMSISSGFLDIPQGSKGVIPAHRSEEVKFAFRPSLAGTFAESLSVTNVLDERNTQVITIKAKVYKPETFALVDPPEVMRMQPCLVGEELSARPQGEGTRVLLRNTTARRRVFVIEGADAYSPSTAASLGRDSVESAAVSIISTAAATATNTTGGDAAASPGEGTWSETSVALAEVDSKGTSLSPRPDLSSSRLRLSSAGSDVTIATDVSRPVQESGASMVLPSFNEATACTACFRFKVDAVSAPGIPEEERQRMEEKLEQYQFKLRIAERKHRYAKAAKINKKIDRVRRRLAGEAVDGSGDDGEETGMSESESDSDAELLQMKERSRAGRRGGGGGGGGSGNGGFGFGFGFGRREGLGRLQLSLDGDSEVAVEITVSFTPGAYFQGWEGGQLFRGLIRLYESRNEDVVKELPCVAQVYSSASAYQAAQPPSAPPSVDDEGEDRGGWSPLPLTPTPSNGSGVVTGGGCGRSGSASVVGSTSVRPGRKPNGKPSLPPRSPSDASPTSPTPSFFKPINGGRSGPPISTMSAPSVLSGPMFNACGGTNGGGGMESTSSSPRGGGRPELLRQVGHPTLRVFGGSGVRDRDQERTCSSDRGSESSERQPGASATSSIASAVGDTEGNGNSIENGEDCEINTESVAGKALGDDGILASVPARLERSPSPSLGGVSTDPVYASEIPGTGTADVTGPTSGSSSSLRVLGHASSPSSNSRAGGHQGCGTDVRDLQGADGRGPPSPPGFALSDSVEDVYDPGGGGGGGSGSSSLIPHHSPATPTSPAFSDGSNWRVTHSEVPRAVPSMDTRGELPFFVMIAPSCSLGGAEEGGAVSVECDDGGSMMNASLSTGGGGAVTPSMLPVLFPRESGCALSEGVRMVINVSEAEGTTLLSSSGEASTAMFSVHSVTSRDVIVKVSWDEDSTRRLGVLPAPSTSDPFRVEFSGNSGGQTTQPPVKVHAAMLHGQRTLDVSVKLDGTVSVPVGRWCVGAVLVTYVDPSLPCGNIQGGGGGIGSEIGGGAGAQERMLVPVILESLPESYLRVPRRVDLGSVSLGSDTSSKFKVQNTSTSMSVRFVVMVAGKPSTHGLLLTSQQTGLLAPGAFMDVSFAFHAASVGRWSHELTVRNLSNKHDQVKVTISATVKPRMYLHFPDLDQEAKGKPDKLQIGYCYMPNREAETTQALPRTLHGTVGAAGAAVREKRQSLEVVRASDSSEFEIVRPLRVRNVSDRKLYLTCSRNLKKQCFVYAEVPTPQLPGDISSPIHEDDRGVPTPSPCSVDGEISTGLGRPLSVAGLSAGASGLVTPRSQVADLLLLPQSETTLFIGLRPVLPSEAYITGDCRELIGGIRILGCSRPLAEALELNDYEGRSAFEGNEESGVVSSDAGETAASIEQVSTSAAVSAGNLQVGSSAESPESRLATDRLFELTIKFVGTVGVSILRLRGQGSSRFELLLPKGPTSIVRASDALVGSGGLPHSSGEYDRRRVVYGSLELENVTKALPLKYRISSGREKEAVGGNMGGNNLGRMDEVEVQDRLQNLPMGSAELVLLSPMGGELAPASRRRVRFCVLLHAFQGVFRREITVENLSTCVHADSTRTVLYSSTGAPAASMGSSLRHVVQFFVDDGSITLWTAGKAAAVSSPPSLVRFPEAPALLNHGESAVPSTLGSSGHNASCASDTLSDLDGNLLPPLETLSLLLTVNVAMPEPADMGDSGEQLEKGAVDDFRRFRVLPVVFPQGNAEPSSPSSCGPDDPLDDIVEGKESPFDCNEGFDRDESERQWSGSEAFVLSPASFLPRSAGGGGGGDDEVGIVEDVDESGVLEIRLANRLKQPIVLAPYSNLPVMMTPVALGQAYFDDDFALPFMSDFPRGREDSTRQKNSIDESKDMAEVDAELKLFSTSDNDQNARQCVLRKCGPAFILAANSTRRLKLGSQTGALTEPLPNATMSSGRAMPFEGLVALARVNNASPAHELGEGMHGSHPVDSPAVSDRLDSCDFIGLSCTDTCSLFAPLVKLMRVVGTYCLPKFEVVGPPAIDLGNVGHTFSKRGRRRFEVRLRSLCDTPIPVGLTGLSPELELVNMADEDSEEQVARDHDVSDNVPRRKTGGHVSTVRGSAGGSKVSPADRPCEAISTIWKWKWPSAPLLTSGTDEGRDIVAWIPARRELTIPFQLRLSRRLQSWAGPQKFSIRLVNLADSKAEEIAVAVHARVVTHLVSILGLDEPPPSPMLLRLVSPGTPHYPAPPPMRSLSAGIDSPSMGSPAYINFGSFGASSGGSVRLAPLAIPPLKGSPGRRTESFQVKNVSDETVSIILRVAPAPEVAGIVSLGATLQQDSTPGVYASAGADGRPSASVALHPGELLDVNVECMAQPGAYLPAELLPPPPTDAAEFPGEPFRQQPGGVRSRCLPDWLNDVRLMGTARVEIALEGREAGPDDMTDRSPKQQDGVLIESVALLGTLIPGQTFGTSSNSVTIALRPPENSDNSTGPFSLEGPASFLVETLSEALGPLHFKLTCRGRLRLDRGVCFDAIDDEGGSRHRLAQVAKTVAVVAEPCGGIVLAKEKREVVVRLAAVSDGEEPAGRHLVEEMDMGDVDPTSGHDIINVGNFDDGELHFLTGLYVIITDTDHPGYPPQVVSVRLEFPATTLLESMSAHAGVLGMGIRRAAGVEDGSVGLFRVRELGHGSYGLASPGVGDRAGRILTGEANSSGTRGSERAGASLPVSPTASTATNSLTPGTMVGDANARDRPSSRAGSSASFEAVTAAAIAAGPSALTGSHSDMSRSPSPPLPRLELHHCTPIGPGGVTSSRFKINLGQQVTLPSSLEWEISLVRPRTHWFRRGSPSVLTGESWRLVQGIRGSGMRRTCGRVPVDYRLRTLHTSDAEWLTLGRKEGQLMEAEVEKVTLYLNRSRVGMFSTYMYVENLTTPEDLKVVRVEMEVVDGGLEDSAAALFEVLVPRGIPMSSQELLSTTTDIDNREHDGGDGGGGIARSVDGDAGRGSGAGGRPSTAAGIVSSGGDIVGVGGRDAGLHSDKASSGGSVDRSVGGSRGSSGTRGTSGWGGSSAPKNALVLDYGDVYEGMLYQRRSFVIANHASMPLEFQLSSSLPAYELNFSLSAVTLKQFKSVIVEAHTRLHVYAHYRPMARRTPASVICNACECAGKGNASSDISGCATAMMSAVGREGTGRRARDDPPFAPRAGAVRERLSITCRLVKDFQQEILLVARQHTPQLRLVVDGGQGLTVGDSVGILFVVREPVATLPPEVTSSGERVFNTGARGEATPTRRGSGGGVGGIEIDGESDRFVKVTNLRPRRRIVIAVVNVSMYFSVTPVVEPTTAPGSGSGSGQPARTVRRLVSGGDGGCFRTRGVGLCPLNASEDIELFEVPAGESLTLRVTPRLDKLRSGEGLSLLANEQLLEEHFMVYNRKHPTEQYRVSLKLTSGALRTFFLSPGSKNAHAFSTLENKITTFLQAYKCMWREFMATEPQLQAMLSVKERGGVAFKESELVVFRRALDRLDAAMVAAGDAPSTITATSAGGSNSNAWLAARNRGVSTGGGSSSSGGGTRFSRSVGSWTSLDTAVVAQRSSRLIFEIFYLTDELLYYALKHEGRVGEFAIRLANLLFSVVFRGEVFTVFNARPDGGRHQRNAPLFLRRWGAHLNHFLGYFPYPKPVILPLVELRRSLAPCFIALPAGDGGREREGAPTADEMFSSESSLASSGNSVLPK